MLGVRNPALWWVAGGASAFLALTLSVPAVRGVFRFSPVHVDDLAICLVAGLAPVLMFEAFKMTRRATRSISRIAAAALVAPPARRSTPRSSTTWRRVVALAGSAQIRELAPPEPQRRSTRADHHADALIPLARVEWWARRSNGPRSSSESAAAPRWWRRRATRPRVAPSVRASRSRWAGRDQRTDRWRNRRGSLPCVAASDAPCSGRMATARRDLLARGACGSRGPVHATPCSRSSASSPLPSTVSSVPRRSPFPGRGITSGDP